MRRGVGGGERGERGVSDQVLVERGDNLYVGVLSGKDFFSLLIRSGEENSLSNSCCS